jgi:hypothetical protein
MSAVPRRPAESRLRRLPRSSVISSAAGRPFARHVGHHERNPPVAKLDDIVVVATDLGRRLHPGVNRHRSVVRRLGGHEGRLDLTGGLEVCAHFDAFAESLGHDQQRQTGQHHGRTGRERRME